MSQEFCSQGGVWSQGVSVPRGVSALGGYLVLEGSAPWGCLVWGAGGDPPEHLLLQIFCKFFTENCMKMKEFGPGGGCASLPPLDPPMNYMISFTTRQHSSRMHTACLENVCASVSVATTRCHSGGRSQNEQV